MGIYFVTGRFPLTGGMRLSCFRASRRSEFKLRALCAKEPASFSDLTLHLPGVEISTLRVGASAPLVGKSLAEIELRKRYGVTILAILRDSQTLPNPHGDIQLSANDELFVLGPPDKIAGISSLFHNSEEREVS